MTSSALQQYLHTHHTHTHTILTIKINLFEKERNILKNDDGDESNSKDMKEATINLFRNIKKVKHKQ